jgi:hypothetical protein
MRTGNLPRVARWACGPGLLIAGALAAASLTEWVRIGVVADPEVIKAYYFGSEAMVAHGGWTYRSAATYATTALAEGVVGLGVVALFAVGFTRPGRRLTALAYGVLAAVVLAKLLLP